MKEILDRLIECLTGLIECLKQFIGGAPTGNHQENNMGKKGRRKKMDNKHSNNEMAKEDNRVSVAENGIKPAVQADRSSVNHDQNSAQQASSVEEARRALKKLEELARELEGLKSALGESNDGDPKLRTLFGSVKTLRENVRDMQKGLNSNLLNGSSPKLSDLVKDVKTEVIQLKSSAAKENSLKSVVSAVDGALRNEVQFVQDTRQRVIGLQNSLNGFPMKFDELKSSISKLQQAQGELSDFAESGFQSTLKSELKPMQALETMSGKVVNLASDIEDVKRVLTDKGLEVRQKFPAANTDEEVICQMAEYGRTILDQLSIAARWYARSKTDIDQASDLRAQAEKEYQRGLDEGKKAGINEGKARVIEELVNRYGDCAKLLLDDTDQQNADERLSILADFLHAEGLHRGHSKDEIIEVHNEQEAAMLENPPLEFPKKVCITKGDYYLGDKLLQRAQWKPVEENAPEGAPTADGPAEGASEQNANGSEGSAPVNE